MSNYTTIIENFLDSEELHYNTKTYDWGSDTCVGFSRKGSESVTVHLVNREGRILSLDVVDLVHIPDSKMAEAIIYTNMKNRDPFLRFSIDRDNDVNMTYDFPLGLTEESFADVLKAMFPMFIMAVHKYHKDYNKMLWGNPTAAEDKPVEYLA